MSDQQLIRDLKALDRPVEPDPAFGASLFASLEAEYARPARPRRHLVMLLAAALLLALSVGITIAVGAGLLKLPWLVQDDRLLPTSSPAVSPEGSPQPSPQVMVVQSGPLPTPCIDGGCGSSFSSPSFWIRAKVDLVARDYPTYECPTPLDASCPISREIGVLAAGEVARVGEVVGVGDGTDAWLNIESASVPNGYVASLRDGAEQVDRFGIPPVSASIWEVAAGADGFVLRGDTGHGLGQLASQTFLAASRDGAAWDRLPVDLPEGWQLASRPLPAEYWSGHNSIAWGPAGWLTSLNLPGVFDYPEGNQSGVGPLGILTSADAVTWSLLGTFGESDETGLPYDSWGLVGSDLGYLLSTGGFWFSADGETWHEARPFGLAEYMDPMVVATEQAFYAWDRSPQTQVAGGAYSLDGRTWSPVGDGPSGPGMQLGGLPGALVAVDLDPTGAVRAWDATIEGERLSWQRAPGQDEVFAGAAVTGMASHGQLVVAIGFDRTTEAPLAWLNDGSGWERSALPARFEGIPQLVAAGPSGVITVGSRPTAYGLNPIIWHLESNGSWAPERSPFIDVVPDPAEADCPNVPGDAFEFLILDPAVAAHCFGDAPITVRAWAAVYESVHPNESPLEPAWLAEHHEVATLQLSPFERTVDCHDGWGTCLPALDPSLEMRSDWHLAWLDVTGHFNDPRSEACHNSWPYGLDAWIGYWAGYGGRELIVEGCRRRFVITAVTVVDGP